MMKYNSSLKLPQKNPFPLNTDKTYLAYTFTLGRGVIKYEEEKWCFFYGTPTKKKIMKPNDLKKAMFLG